MRFKLIAQYHPAAALHQPRLWSTMIDDWENLPQKEDCGYIVVDDNSSGYLSAPVVSLDTENAPDGSLGQWSVAYRNKEGKTCVKSFYGKQNIEFHNQVVMHNAKWDLRVMRNAGMKEPEDVVDTMVAAYCLGLGRQDTSADGSAVDSAMVGGLGLKYLARRHLGMEMKTWKDVEDKPDLIPEYNANDSVATLLLWEKWQPRLQDFFWKIDMPLLRVLMAIEDRGVAVDPKFLDGFKSMLDQELSKFNLPINPFSHKQVADYVYGELKIEPFRFTKNKAPSVDEEVLETIDDPLVRQILAYKKLYKERGTYVQNYIDRVSIEGRIHPEFKQCRTATARPACSNPNLQNIPNPEQDEEAGEIRKLFIAAQGKKLVRLDWKQLELRFFAVYTNEETMLDALMRGEDIHQWTANLLGCSRYEAKTMNFLMLYGGSAWTISQELHVPIDKAKEMVAAYFKRFPGIARYMQEIKEQCETEKRVTNWMGRTRRMDAMYAHDWRVREKGIREGINTPIQGGASEIVKLAMIDLHYKHSAPMILQVHDELLFEVDEKDAEEYAQWLKIYVPTITEFKGVQFPVEIGLGDNWWQAMKK